MSCLHKFAGQLNLDRLDFEPVTLIVGTFIPAWPESSGSWFYGRTEVNYFWNIIQRLYGEESMLRVSPDEWKLFCRKHRIALTDLISSIDDAEEESLEHRRILVSHSDKAYVHNFDDFSYVDIVGLLRQHPSIENVYLTRSTTESFWRHLWNPVSFYCATHNIHEGRLITPSGDAVYHLDAHNYHHPEKSFSSIEDYLLSKWREEWRH